MRILQHLPIQRQVGNDLLQPTILVFKLLYPSKPLGKIGSIKLSNSPPQPAFLRSDLTAVRTAVPKKLSNVSKTVTRWLGRFRASAI